MQRCPIPLHVKIIKYTGYSGKIRAPLSSVVRENGQVYGSILHEKIAHVILLP